MILLRRKIFSKLIRSQLRSISSRTKKGEVPIPDAKKLAEPWNERKGVWKSTFEYFEPKISFFGPDFITLMQTPIDLSPKNVRKWYNRRTEEQEEKIQRFIPERYGILGPDLAAAHFVVHRGGAIRFINEKEWIRKKDDGSYTLPSNFVPGLFIEAIDFKEFNLRRSGLDNILDLEHLRWLSLANNPGVDDWTLDSLSGSYAKTLQYLDLSHCNKVSHRALYCFHRFEVLDTLVVEGISNSPEFKLSCMMLEDLKPKLTIKGIDYSVSEEVKDSKTETQATDQQPK